MRFLKRKIRLIQDFLEDQDNEHDVKIEEMVQNSTGQSSEQDSETNNSESIQEYLLPMRKPRSKPTCPNANSKNIVKNYGKALCSFASSKVAIPYLDNIVEKNELKPVSVSSFAQYIKLKKEGLNSIESLRRLLVLESKDSVEISCYKILFKEVSIIFLKYFSVNWIFGGRLAHKDAHMKFRFKMLRRVQDPEHFTYLKASAK